MESLEDELCSLATVSFFKFTPGHLEIIRPSTPIMPVVIIAEIQIAWWSARRLGSLLDTKLFGLPVIWCWAYLMNVIPETYRAHWI